MSLQISIKQPSDYRVCFVTPVKGHSERLANKNILEVLGKPMFVWSLEQIVASKYCDRKNSFVITESQEVLDLLGKWGYAVPWFPNERRVDQTGIVDLAMYLNWAILYDAEDPPDILCIVYANCPARDPKTIDKCIELVIGGANSVRTYNSKGYETGNVWAYRVGDAPRAWYTYTAMVLDDAIEIHTEKDLEGAMEELRKRQFDQIEKEVVKGRPPPEDATDEDRAILDQRL